MILLSIVHSIKKLFCIFILSLSIVEAIRRHPEETRLPSVHGRRLTSVDSEQTSRFAANSDDPDSHLVTSLPLLPDGSFPTRHWAGHLPAEGEGLDKKIFYWLFEPSNAGQSNDNTPLILWLNGGPGCSSMDGLWLENGPFRLKPHGDDWIIDINDYSWHNSPAWTLYVDQPVGTGLSFTRQGNYCKNDFEVNRDFHYFLEEFFLLHKDKFLKPITHSDNPSAKWSLRRPFYFSGESHAGHYIPSMMNFILQRNDGLLNPSESNGLLPLRVIIPCSGAAIGNGWTDPYYQYSVSDAAFAAGLIGMAQRASLDDDERTCQSNLKAGKYSNDICFYLLENVVSQSHGKNGNTIVSSYDTRLWEKKGVSRAFPFGHKDVETYLGGAKSQSSPPLVIDFHRVLVAIHADESIDAKQTYQECTDPPYYALEHQDGLGVANELIQVLEHKSKPHILFFNGMNDLICNHVGNEKLLDALNWSGKKNYQLQPRHAWDSGVDPSTKKNYINGRPDGYVKQYENLTFLKILESGHMVPMDQPSVALSMIKTLVSATGISREGYLKSIQSLSTADINKDASMCHLDECPDCRPEVLLEPAGMVKSVQLSSSVRLISVVAVIGAVASVILMTCLYLRKKKKERMFQRELISNHNDLELSDVDTSYRDKVEDAEFS